MMEEAERVETEEARPTAKTFVSCTSTAAVYFVFV